MVARPGRIQTTFSSGEIAPSFHARTEQKAYNGGLARAENIEIVPQGGFRVAPRLAHVGDAPATASRIFPFDASDGSAWDVILSAGYADVWSSTSLAAHLAIPHAATEVAAAEWAQQLDAGIIFHPSRPSRRVKVSAAAAGGPYTWATDEVPYENIPNWDFGAAYTNGVPAKWQLELIGFKATATTLVEDIAFRLTVSRQNTASLTPTMQSGSTTAIDGTATAAAIRAAILALPNVKPGVTVTPVTPTVGVSVTRYDIEFAGTGNEGDGWAVSGEVLNKADAAVTSYHTVLGVKPGEPFMSTARGWPACGKFYNQRLVIGGMKSLPNAWAYSIEGQYWNFDDRLDEANGSAIVPMDSAGGEAIRHFFDGRNLCIFTSKGEYWLAERTLDKTKVPTMVKSSEHGTSTGAMIAENEGAGLFIHASKGVVGEFMYTDVTGNFRSQDLTLFASHLMAGISDHVVRRSTQDGEGNRHFLVRDDGAALLGTLLREQEITAYARFTTDGAFRACGRNGRNEIGVLVDRSRNGTTVRSFERVTAGQLLDGALTLTPGSATVTGLSRFEGAEVWAIGDGDVFGPYTVASGVITLPKACASVTVGRWKPPIADTLPLGRTVGPDIWVQRRARIHSVQVLVEDTTSIAIGAVGGKTWDQDLRRWGDTADEPELARGYTGWVKVRGLKGYSDTPAVRITQHRPGRLFVKAIVVETNIGS